jgi:hypothetical protein
MRWLWRGVGVGAARAEGAKGTERGNVLEKSAASTKNKTGLHLTTPLPPMLGLRLRRGAGSGMHGAQEVAKRGAGAGTSTARKAECLQHGIRME